MMAAGLQVTQAGSSWQGWPAECIGHTLIEQQEYQSYDTIRSTQTSEGVERNPQTRTAS